MLRTTLQIVIYSLFIIFCKKVENNEDCEGVSNDVESLFTNTHPKKEVSYWKGNDSVVKLMVSITSAVSFWNRPYYKNMLNYDNEQKMLKFYDNIKVDFLW